MEIGDPRVADALKLYLVDGLAIRVIAKKLGMSRNTVRRLVGRGVSKPRVPAPPRTSLLTPYETKLKTLVERINALQDIFETIRNDMSPLLDNDIRRRSMHSAYQKSLKTV